MASQNGVAIEIVKVVATDAYLADKRNVVAPTLSIVGSAKGLLSSYHGVAIQDPKAGFIVNVWQSLDHHAALVNDTEAFGQIIKNLGAMSAELKYLVHTHINADPFSALNAPTTELALWTLKEGADVEVFKQKVDELVKFALGWGPSAGIYNGGWGPVKENERQYFVILGWTDLETFTKSVQASERAMQLIAELKEFAELELLHTVLEKF